MAAAAITPDKTPVKFKWSTLKNTSQLKKEMINYLKGKYTTSPWMGDSLLFESKDILNELLRINELNYITVESQPDLIEFPLIHFKTKEKILKNGEELVYKQHFYSSGLVDKRKVDLECLKSKLGEIPHFFSVIFDFNPPDDVEEQITYINLDESSPDLIKPENDRIYNLSYSHTKEGSFLNVDTIFNIDNIHTFAYEIATDDYGTISDQLLEDIFQNTIYLHIIDYRISNLGDVEKRNALQELITIFESCQIKDDADDAADDDTDVDDADNGADAEASGHSGGNKRRTRKKQNHHLKSHHRRSHKRQQNKRRHNRKKNK